MFESKYLNICTILNMYEWGTILFENIEETMLLNHEKSYILTEIWAFLCHSLPPPTLPITQDWKFGIFCCFLSFLVPHILVVSKYHKIFPVWLSQLLSLFHSFGYSIATLYWDFCQSLLSAVLFLAPGEGSCPGLPVAEPLSIKQGYCRAEGYAPGIQTPKF